MQLQSCIPYSVVYVSICLLIFCCLSPYTTALQLGFFFVMLYWPYFVSALKTKTKTDTYDVIKERLRKFIPGLSLMKNPEISKYLYITATSCHWKHIDRIVLLNEVVSHRWLVISAMSLWSDDRYCQCNSVCQRRNIHNQTKAKD